MYSVVVLFFFVTVGILPLSDAEGPTKSRPALPGEPCQTAPLESWTPQEKWVWQHVCEGKIADFNEAKDYGGKLDPKKPKGWPSNRVVRPTFLETILLHDPYRSALTRHGVHIHGAWVKDSLDLSNATLAHPLFLEHCRFESDVNLLKLKSSHLIELGNSTFRGTLNMDSLQLGSSLLMNHAEFSAVILQSAKIGSQLAMIGSKFRGKLNMDSLQVEQSLIMRDGAALAEVRILGAKIGGDLDMAQSKFMSKLEMDRVKVEDILHMKKADFAEVDLGGAKIGGNVLMEGSKFSGALDMSLLQTGSDLYMTDARFARVILRGANIAGTLNMDGSKFSGALDMDVLQVQRSLFMRSADFAQVILIAAMIKGNLEMTGSRFTDTLNMDTLQVGGNLLMHRQAKFAEVVLRGANIAGTLDMDGSKFSGALDMNELQVQRSLFMRSAEFAQVILIAAMIKGNLEMTGSRFTDTLNMDTLQVGGNLFMRSQAKFAEVVLRGANIAGTLDMDGSKFSGALDMNSLQVQRGLFMRNAEFAQVILIAAMIKGNLEMDGSRFTDTLNMSTLQVGKNLFMNRQAKFAEVVLRGGKIGGQLVMDEGKFDGELYMDSLRVEGVLFIRKADFAERVTLTFAEISSNLDLSGSMFASVDMMGTRVRGEFRLGSIKHKGANWHKDSKLILRNTEVGGLEVGGLKDPKQAWPEKGNLELDGFTYGRLGGDMLTQNSSWFREWLARQGSYSPQPYEHLASILLKAGYKDKASDILYASRERERSEAGWPYWAWLTALKFVIGYGYRIYYAFVWVFLLVAIGALVFRRTEEARKNRMPYGIAYSVDMLLPIIKLRERHYDIDLPGWPRYYFYFHKIMGYVLASFLIAGLSGLTR